LDNKILRHVSEAFAEDPVRVLRVARFRARFGSEWRIAKETVALMCELVKSGELDNLTKERVWAETQKAMSEPHPEEFIRTLSRCGALSVLFPEINPLSAFLAINWTSATTPPGKFASAVFHLDPATITAMCARMKIPTFFREVAVTASVLATENHKNLLQAENLLDLFERTDAIRKPVQFLEAVPVACKVLTTDFLSGALEEMNGEEVKVTPEEVASVPREKIGELKRQKRVALLEKLLVQCGV